MCSDVLSLFYFVHIVLGLFELRIDVIVCPLNSVCHLLWSRGGDVLVLDPVKWTIIRPKTKTPSIIYMCSCFLHLKKFGEKCSVRYLYLLFVIFWQTYSVFLDVLSLLFFVRYLNRAAWILLRCTFCGISFLSISHWNPVKTTSFWWIQSNGLSCAHKVRASNLKHWECYSYHLLTLLVEESFFRRLYFSFFLPLTRTFHLFRCIGPFQYNAISQNRLFSFFHFCLISFWYLHSAK